MSSGGSSLTGSNPLFASLPADNYHLQFGSPAIDRGHDIGITIDFDGDPRPFGASFDIGFDERAALTRYIYLPLIAR